MLLDDLDQHTPSQVVLMTVEREKPNLRIFCRRFLQQRRRKLERTFVRYVPEPDSSIQRGPKWCHGSGYFIRRSFVSFVVPSIPAPHPPIHSTTTTDDDYFVYIQKQNHQRRAQHIPSRVDDCESPRRSARGLEENIVDTLLSGSDPFCSLRCSERDGRFCSSRRVILVLSSSALN